MELTQAPFHTSLCDCTVTLSGSDGETPVQLPAHRLVLAKSSEVFARCIANWSHNDGTCVVDVSTTSIRISEALVHFAYFDRIPDDLADRDIVRLVVAADKYAMYPLVTACVRRWTIAHRTLEWQELVEILELPDVVLSSNVGVDTFVRTTLATDVRHRFRDLEHAWAQTEERQRFLRLPVRSVLDLFSWQDMKASEDAVLIAMMSWMRTRKSRDPAVLSALFSTLRVQHLSPCFLHDVLFKDPDLGTHVDRDVLYGVVEHRDTRTRKRPRLDSEPRPAARDKVSTEWTMPIGLVSGALHRLLASGVSGTVTLRSARTLYIRGVWWESFVHVAAEKGRSRIELLFGLTPSIRTDRLVAADAPELKVIYTPCDAYDAEGYVNMNGVLTQDHDPDPDIIDTWFRLDETQSRKFVAEVSGGDVSFCENTTLYSGLAFKVWNPRTIDWFERTVDLTFSVTAKSVDDVRDPINVDGILGGTRSS